MRITTTLGIAGVALFITAGAVSVAAISDQVEHSVCMWRAPIFNTTAQSGETPVRAGYELIDIARGHAWATRDWTPKEFNNFKLPATWALWFKNGPRISFADRASFSRSPGCAEDGQYSYMNAFGKTFVLVARPFQFNPIHDPKGLIQSAKVEKYHTLYFDAESSVSFLKNPDGQSFVAVGTSYERSSEAPPLPDGWSIEKRVLTEALTVSLKGEVMVLRLQNGFSFQGPISG